MNKALAFLAAVSVAVLPASAMGATDGKNRHIIVKNLSSQSIYFLYASPVTSDRWEEDLLGEGRVVSSGESVNANIDNGTNECYYDLKAVMANDREYVRRQVNICAVSTWSIGDGGDSLN